MIELYPSGLLDHNELLLPWTNVQCQEYKTFWVNEFEICLRLAGNLAGHFFDQAGGRSYRKR